jgi:hypothetical protein
MRFADPRGSGWMWAELAGAARGGGAGRRHTANSTGVFLATKFSFGACPSISVEPTICEQHTHLSKGGRPEAAVLARAHCATHLRGLHTWCCPIPFGKLPAGDTVHRCKRTPRARHEGAHRPQIHAPQDKDWTRPPAGMQLRNALSCGRVSGTS